MTTDNEVPLIQDIQCEIVLGQETKINEFDILPFEDQIRVSGRAQLLLAKNPEGEIVLLKKFNKKRASSVNLSDYQLKPEDKAEIDVVRSLVHPHICKSFQVLDDNNEPNAFIVMEYLSGGPSMSYDTAKKRFFSAEFGESLPDERIKSILRGILSALAYMHDLGFVHRDIKPANILMSKEGVAKLIDFGTSEQVKIEKDGQLLVESHKKSVLIGTVQFLPLEAYTEPGFDGAKGDIWAVGVSLYAYLLGTLPINEGNQMKFITEIKKMKKVKLPKQLKGTKKKPGPPSVQLLTAMLNVRKPEARPSAAELLTNSYFN